MELFMKGMGVSLRIAVLCFSVLMLIADGQEFSNSSVPMNLELNAAHKIIQKVNTNNPGDEVWKYEPDGYVYSSPAIDDDGTIYFGDTYGYVTALNPDGSVAWKFKTDDEVQGSPVIGEDGTIYICSKDNYLYALNPDSTLNWKNDLGTSSITPALGEDGTIYVYMYAALYVKSYLLALNTDGTEKWKYETGDAWSSPILTSPVIDQNGTIYFACEDDKVYAVNSDGTGQWTYEMDSGPSSNIALDANGILYIGDFYNIFYALNPDGTLKWKFEADGEEFSTPTVGADGTIYVCNSDKNLYAINPDGTEKWKFNIENKDAASSPTIGESGAIYVGSSDYHAYPSVYAHFYAVNPDGTEKWKFQLSEKGCGIWSPPVISDDGLVLFGATDGYFYALQTESSGLADAPWPVFGHDVKHTGRASPQAVGLSADFTADVNSGAAPLEVQFTDQSTGDPTSWSWNFGDDETSTIQNPSHTYQNTGTYTVSLTISDGTNSDEEIKTDYITVQAEVVQIDTLLYEGFEGSVEGWMTIDNDADGNTWVIYTEDPPADTIAYTGSCGAGVIYNPNGNDDWLISPQIQLPTDMQLQLSFYAHSYQSEYLEDFNVKLSTTGQAIEDFTTPLGQETDVSAVWSEYSYDLDDYAGSTIYLAIQCVSVDDYYLLVDDILVTASGESVEIMEGKKSIIPSDFILYQNYPNPFNPVTTIAYDLSEDGYVKLTVYNIRGEVITNLVKGNQEAGSYQLHWNGRDQNGNFIPSGIYLLKISAGNFIKTNKMVFIR